MKYLGYILLIVMAFVIMGCNEQAKEGTEPSKDTEAVIVRNEDAYYEVTDNPLDPEYKAKEKAKMDALIKELVIKDEKVGEGEAVKDGDTVKVHYTGSLDNGKVFDTSLKGENPQPFSFKVGSGMVIKGWDLGLVGMKVGGKRHLDIPAGLGYGDQHAGPIPPNSILHFDIELLGIGE